VGQSQNHSREESIQSTATLVVSSSDVKMDVSEKSTKKTLLFRKKFKSGSALS
jgi:hypothetical protein